MTQRVTPRVVMETAGWTPASIATPKINESAGAELTQHASFRHGGNGALTMGCVATSIPGWVEDMQPAVEARTIALAGASAALGAGHPIDARPAAAGVFELRSANDVNGSVIGQARTFIGFGDDRLHTCFATCTGAPDCQRAIASARLEGGSPPPSPGIALAGVTWAVHHSKTFALGTAVFIVVVAIASIGLRRKPRHRASI